VTILVIINFLFCKLVFKLIITVTNYFLVYKLVSNQEFSWSELSYHDFWSFYQDLCFIN